MIQEYDIKEESPNDTSQKTNLVLEEETRISRIRRIILPQSKKSSLISNDIENLEGKTLQIYWYLYEHGPSGVREIQRVLNYNSPGIITYQIKKLSENGLIIKDKETEKYKVHYYMKPGLLNFYIKIGSWLVPRFSVYLLIFFLGFAFFLIGMILWGDLFIIHPSSLVLLLFLFLESIFFIYESKIMRKLKPF